MQSRIAVQRSFPLRWWLPALWLTVFVTSGVLFYWVGRNAIDRRQPDPAKAQAWVRIQPLAGAAEQQPVATLLPPDLQALRNQVVSEAAVSREIAAHALAGQAAGWPAERIAELRSHLDVAIADGKGSAAMQIAISCDDRDSRAAVALVNGLAERYAEGCREKLRTDLDQAFATARDAAERARQEFRTAKADLDEFLDRHFCQEPPGGKADQPPRETAPAPSAPPATDRGREESSETVVLIENPEWVRLHQEITEGQCRRAQLLIVRTAAHPEVQRLEGKIAEEERRLAEIPRQIRQKSTERRIVQSFADPKLSPDPTKVPAVESKPVADRAPAGPDPAAERDTCLALSAALDKASQDRQRLAEAERQAWLAQRSVPRVEVVLAAPIVVPPAADRAGDAAWIALVVAAALASGIGMVAVGVAIDRPLATVGEVQHRLPLPIVGLLSPTGLPDEPRPARRGGRRSRTSWIASGLVLMAGSAAIVITALR